MRKNGTAFCAALVLAAVVAGLFGSPLRAEEKPKMVIAVMEFEDKANAYGQYGIKAGAGIADVLVNALHKTGRFTIIERQRLNEILDEQGLGRTGLLDPATVARMGGIKGVQMLLMGSVTTFAIERKGVSFGWTSVGSAEARVELQVRLVDTVTGEILFTEMARGTASATSVSLDYGWYRNLSFTSDDFHDSILGKATDAAVKQVMDKIAALFPVEGIVIQMKGGRVYTDLGTASGVAKGMKLLVFREGEVIKHPVTGKVLSVTRDEVARLTVEKAEESMSICTVDPPARIDVIRVMDKVTPIYDTEK